VTISGVDESVSDRELARLSKQYRFVEWGILVSDNRQGIEPRYPSRNWIELLTDRRLRDREAAVHLSAHLCGRAAREIIAGAEARLMDLTAFERIQLNGWSKWRHRMDGWQVVPRRHTEWQYILQCSDDEALDAAIAACGIGGITALLVPLFDPSCGRGIPGPFYTLPAKVGFSGYAGGIGPDNVAGILEDLCDRPDDREFWIDMETRIRTDDGLRIDLDKVETVLQVCAERKERR
jgi:hypothetical protein